MRESIIKSNLFENAITNLENALLVIDKRAEGDNQSIHSAVLNSIRFIELSFKWFLTQRDSSLIYKKTKSNHLDKRRTITMNQAIDIFKQYYDKYIPENEDSPNDSLERDINNLKDIRNDIEHCEYNFDQNKITFDLGKVLAKMDMLYYKFDVSLQHELPLKIRKLYDGFLGEDSRHELIAESEATSTLKKTPDHIDSNSLKTSCNECKQDYLVLEYNLNIYICTLCDNSERAVSCNICNHIFPLSRAYETFDEFYWCSTTCYETDKSGWGCGEDQ